MKYLILLLLVGCQTPVELQKNPANASWPEWQKYCEREGQQDPACEEQNVKQQADPNR